MTQPQYLPGKLEKCLAEPEGESEMVGYRMEMNEEESGRDIDDYQVQFMRDASRLAIINGDTDVDDNAPELQFLN